MRSSRTLGVISALLLSACSVDTGDGKSTLWADSLHLCADTVYRVSVTYGPDSDAPNLNVELNEDAGKHFSRMTARLVGEAMTIRLDDKVLAEPLILERVTGGTFEISRLPPEDFERAWQEMEESC